MEKYTMGVTTSMLFLLVLMVLGEHLVSGAQMPAMTEEKMTAYSGMVKQMQTESMGIPDPRVGEMVDAMGPDDPRNPEEMGTYMEGDMLHPMDMGSVNPTMKFKWPNGIVYYKIDAEFSKKDLALIQEAIGQYHKHTCIKFRPYTGKQKDYISIQSKKTGCWSAVGREGGKQMLNLQSPGCLAKVGTTIHEFMHALGFFHEHSRSDRNKFVDISWKNIKRGHENNFNLRNYDGFGVGYDFGSVMHYSRNAFSIDKKIPTINPKTKRHEDIGQRGGFSATDIQKVNTLYKCSKTRSSYDKVLTPTTEMSVTLSPLEQYKKDIDGAWKKFLESWKTKHYNMLLNPTK